MSEISIKTVCCTCLCTGPEISQNTSKDTGRKLYQLSRLLDGINLLYMLLTHDPVAYKEGFYKDTASLRICWECRAVMDKIKKFRAQACLAQKQLTAIADGRNDVKIKPFSRLTKVFNSNPQYEFQFVDTFAENFIDCGPVKDIKTESDSDDVPLSELYFEDDSYDCYEPIKSTHELRKGTHESRKGTIQTCKDAHKSSKGTNQTSKGTHESGNGTHEPSKGTNEMTNRKRSNENSELGDNLEEHTNLNRTPKSKHLICDNISSNIVPINKTKLKSENISGNTEIKTPVRLKNNIKKKTKMKYAKYFSIKNMNEEEMKQSMEKRKINVKSAEFECNKCIIEFKTEIDLIKHNKDLHELKKDNHNQCDICYAYTEDLHTHKQQHYECYNCLLCVHTSFTHADIVRHLKCNHIDICSKEKKGSKRKRHGFRVDELSKYPCPECDSCFQNKDLRWKHIQRAHREGYKCNTCDKKFAFKSNLERHERIHAGPLPREECPSCHKLIRVDLLKAHSRIHTDRQTHTCVECDKSFVSRATYESHLKYARAHATADVCRYKCPSCHKRYRSRGELRDHINYSHKGKAEHKCPICGKGLATKRCIRRHVRRTHEGIRENAKDKICMQCGKAFRDKKGLIEHERVHSGARPLSCATCGRAFRQRSALYVHTRRLHADRNIT